MTSEPVAGSTEAPASRDWNWHLDLPLENSPLFAWPPLHWFVAPHPIHVLFHNLWNTLGAVTSHAGYDSLLIKDKDRLAPGFFHHQLHHRYFECNYGNAEMPWDKWFGSFHDGSSDATERVRECRRQMHGTS